MGLTLIELFARVNIDMANANLKDELVNALNDCDINKAANIIKTLHSQACTIKLSLYQAPYTSFAPDPVIVAPRVSSYSPHVMETTQSYNPNSNPQIYNELLFLGYSEELSRRVAGLTSSTSAAVDYIFKNNLA